MKCPGQDPGEPPNTARLYAFEDEKIVQKAFLQVLWTVCLKICGYRFSASLKLRMCWDACPCPKNSGCLLWPMRPRGLPVTRRSMSRRAKSFFLCIEMTSQGYSTPSSLTIICLYALRMCPVTFQGLPTIDLTKDWGKSFWIYPCRWISDSMLPSSIVKLKRTP